MTHRMAMTAGLILVGWIGLAQQASLGQSISESGWRKHTINDRSPYEAAGAADFNKDGKIDVFSGDSWYAAPDWVRHQVREVPNVNPHYHEDFADLPMDVNGDGRMDIITCSYFSKRIAWIENPADPTQRWTEHTVDTPGSMETGYLVDINDDGQRDFLPNIGSTVAWYEIVSKKPEVKWKKYDLGKDGRGHGIGAGFVNSDSYMDIVTPKGWYEQPTDYKTPWSFHAEFDLGAASIPIIVRDLDGDGDSDILWGMGHDFGLFWMTQAYGSQGQREWTKQRIDASFSQVHTLHLADVDGDRISEIITGKRVYAHEAEPGATDAPCLYQFKLDRAQSRWIKQVIYEGKPAANAPPPEEKEKRSALNDFERGSAGTGLLLESIDLDKDGDLDLICPGKSGLYWFENLRVTNSRSASSPR